ncbi:MAG: insulinase family protein, partial [Waterburya sp.]
MKLSKLIGIYWVKKLRWLTFMAIALLFWNFSGIAVLAAPQTNQPNSEIQPYLNRFMQQITEFTLDNGLKFIVLENHDAPVVSFVTYANV